MSHKQKIFSKVKTESLLTTIGAVALSVSVILGIIIIVSLLKLTFTI